MKIQQIQHLKSTWRLQSWPREREDPTEKGKVAKLQSSGSQSLHPPQLAGRRKRDLEGVEAQDLCTAGPGDIQEHEPPLHGVPVIGGSGQQMGWTLRLNITSTPFKGTAGR